MSELNFKDALLVIGAKEYGIKWIVNFDSENVYTQIQAYCSV